MIAYVTVGADDIARAKRFYSAFLPALGYGLTEGPEGLSYVLWQTSSVLEDEGELHIYPEVLDGAVVGKHDLLLRDPGPSNTVDGALCLGDAFAYGILERPG